jgi:hypothetical protein
MLPLLLLLLPLLLPLLSLVVVVVGLTRVFPIRARAHTSVVLRAVL